MDKTNAMRMLDQKKIKYNVYEYPHQEGEAVDGFNVATLLGEDPKYVFKTLVCVDNTKHYRVCVVNVVDEIDLKKARKAFGVKSLEMIAVKELLPLTGYVRGGCSPLGMKKVFPTIVDEKAKENDRIIFSGGKIGLQIEMNPNELSKLIKVEFKDIRRD
ncbi:MAG: Cys-tRNA(Pro) deacylase [Acholeplasmatales bacterium]|nr:Cys-tRNA(Pro) deacylase [Acholeplasmatales bacterium]